MRGLLGGLLATLALTTSAVAKPISITGTLDGKPIRGTVERLRQADGTYVVRATFDNGMTGQGTRLGRGLWKITVTPSTPETGEAVGLRGRLLGEQGKAGETPAEAKPVTLLLTKSRSGVQSVLYRDGKQVGDVRSGASKVEESTPATTTPAKTTDEAGGSTLPRFSDSDQRLGQPAKTTPPPAPKVDLEADAQVMERVLNETILRMNARGERFDHPISFLSGLWGNTLYKYQKTGRFLDAPFGALFDRLYNEDGRYRNVKECYDQAETVLAALRKELPNLSAGWELGMASQPGHYWAAARIDLSKVPGATRTGYMFVQMDPWKDSFEITYGDADSLEWTARP